MARLARPDRSVGDSLCPSWIRPMNPRGAFLFSSPTLTLSIPAPPHRAGKRAAGTPAAGCVAPPSNIARYSRSSRLAIGAGPPTRLPRWGPRGASPASVRRRDFHHGLLGPGRGACDDVEHFPVGGRALRTEVRTHITLRAPVLAACRGLRHDRL